MAIITDFLSIETEIITVVEGVMGSGKVKRHPVDGWGEDNANPPEALVQFLGLGGGAVAAGKNQKVITMWQIGVVASREDYLNIVGVRMVSIARAMLMHKPPEWIRTAKLMDPRERGVPDSRGSLVFYPMVFEIEIVI